VPSTAKHFAAVLDSYAALMRERPAQDGHLHGSQ